MKFAIAVIVLGACDPAPTMPDAAEPWTMGPPVPRISLESGVTSQGDRVIVLDGFDTTVAQGLHIATSVHAYNTLTETWSDLGTAPVAWTHPNLAEVAGTLYLLGGLDGTTFTAKSEVFYLNVGETQWQPVAQPMPEARGSSAVVSAGGTIYLLGGASTTASLATCWSYEPNNASWTQLPDLPVARSHAAAMRRPDGTLIVTGGLATLDATMPLNDTWALPLGAAAWIPKAPMPTARGGCVYGELGTKLVCAGGEAGAAALTVVEAYDYASDSWTTLPPLPAPTAGTQGTVVGTRLFVPGGSRSLMFEPTDSLYIYNSLTTVMRIED